METIALNIGFALVGVGMWKLGKHEPAGFLYQASGAFLMAVTGFFLNEGGVAITCWNIVFSLVGVAGYRRLRGQ